MKDIELRAIREEKRKAIERQDSKSEQEWTARELAWLEEQVERLPNVRGMRSLLALYKQQERKAKRAGDVRTVEIYREKEEALENKMLARQPENQTISRDLRKRLQKRLQVATEAGDTEGIARYEAQKEELERQRGTKEPQSEIATDTGEERRIALAKARQAIYENENVIQVAEEIKVLMEGEEIADRNFLLAELYLHTGFSQRAQKFLKAYKRELNEAGKSVKLVNLGLEVVLNSRSTKFSWDEFWRRKAELEKIVEHEEEEK